jgi:hypothetical protein
VIEESTVRAAGAVPSVSPSKAPAAVKAGNDLVPAKELAEAKKRFLAVAKKKQAEYAKKVQELEDAQHAAKAEASAQRAQVSPAGCSVWGGKPANDMVINRKDGL